MPPGFGVGDGAAVHFVGTELAEVISSRPGARAVYAGPDGEGGVGERELPVRYLGDPPPPAESRPGVQLRHALAA